MESNANFDMEDYWTEYRTVRGRRAELRGSHSEEDSRSHDDDVDSDDTFLDNIFPGGVKGNREINEVDIANNRLYSTLTNRQKEQLVLRAQSRNLTLRQKRLKIKCQKPDLWSVFSATDTSSTGTRSRSATPDSLDSLSPPRTPPDPSPKNWVEPHLSRSRASLDSGHHSLITSPSSSFGPVSPSSSHHLVPLNHNENNHSHHHHPHQHLLPNNIVDKSREVPDSRRYSPPDIESSEKYFYPTDDENGHRVIYRAPSLDILAAKVPKNSVRDPNKEVTVRRQRSYTRDIARDVRMYYNNKGVYEFNPQLLFDGEVDDIQGLRYQPIGSIHLSKSKVREHRSSHDDSMLPSQEIHRKSPSTLVRRSQSIKHPLKDPFQTVVDLDLTQTHHQDTRKWDRINRENLENRSRGSTSSGTDLGFKVICDDPDGFPDLLLEVSRSGQTKIEWLDQDDVTRLGSLALLELDILFTENSISHSWRKRNKKRKNKEVENGVFGACIETLLEKDKSSLPDPFHEKRVPLVIHKLITHIELRGLKEEGILRIPGHRAKTEDLRKDLDENFYSAPDEADSGLRNASPNELAALIKLFLRELPQPLLTHSLAPAFYKAHRIKDLGERVLALTMLVLLLPPSFRNTLKVILDLCGKVIAQENHNKMGLYNVAMIMAPNIFLPSLHSKSWMHIREDKEQQLNNEMEFARVTTSLTQALIKYRDVIWTVPHRLVAQVRRQMETNLRNQNAKPIHKLLSRKPKDVTIQRPITNEVEYQNGVLRITAPQFKKLNHPIKLDWKMTAKDILTRFIEEQTNQTFEGPRRVVGRREQLKTKRSFGSTNSLSSSTSSLTSIPIIPPPVVLTTCLMRGSKSHALENHALHERGGNIAERRIDPCAYLIAIYQDNPNGEFFVQCHHPGGTPAGKPFS